MMAGNRRGTEEKANKNRNATRGENETRKPLCSRIRVVTAAMAASTASTRRCRNCAAIRPGRRCSRSNRSRHERRVRALMRWDVDPIVIAWLDDQPPESIWTTAVTVFEICFGLEILTEGRRRRQL